MHATRILEDYLSRKEFARQLNVDERTVIRWETERRGPRRTKIGRSVYYSLEAVHEWLREHEESPVV